MVKMVITFREMLQGCGEAVIGLEFVKEIFPQKSRTREANPVYNCILEGCKSAWGSSVDMFNHVKNALHLKNVLIVRILISVTRLERWGSE